MHFTLAPPGFQQAPLDLACRRWLAVGRHQRKPIPLDCPRAAMAACLATEECGYGADGDRENPGSEDVGQQGVMESDAANALAGEVGV
jgi:hypothetical protein